MTSFHIGLTRDFLDSDGEIAFGDIGLSLLNDAEGVTWEFLEEGPSHLRPEDIAPYDGILALLPTVGSDTLRDADRLAIIARFGVGYDTIDLDACTRAGVAVTITPDGVRRPVATALLTAVLALAHRLRERDKLVRESRWGERLNYLGTGLTGRTLGIVGLGNIGLDFAHLASPLEMRHIAHDPYVDPDVARAAGVELVDLDTIVRESDFLCICCPLTDDTRHLIDEQALVAMKPTAYLVNTARGPIVVEDALVDALREGRIAGAALDVFDPEPPRPDHPLFEMDNVLLTPHCIAHTDECFRLTGTSAIRSLLDVASGKRPDNVVNKQVLTADAFQRKLDRTTPLHEGAR